MESSYDIGERLRKIRKEKSLTQLDISLKTGISTNSISRYESGERYMSVYNLMLICETLGISADHLLYGKEDEK